MDNRLHLFNVAIIAAYTSLFTWIYATVHTHQVDMVAPLEVQDAEATLALSARTMTRFTR